MSWGGGGVWDTEKKLKRLVIGTEKRKKDGEGKDNAGKHIHINSSFFCTFRLENQRIFNILLIFSH